MSNHVALLRGINVGGKNQIAMAELRVLFETLGFADAKTLLQSGNVVFTVSPDLAPTDAVLTQVMAMRRARDYALAGGSVVHVYEMGEGGAAA